MGRQRANRTIEDMLRHYVDKKQNDWDQHLTMVEIAYNNSKQASTGFSPFFLNSGQHPTLPLSTPSLAPSDPPTNASAEQLLQQLTQSLEEAMTNVQRAQEK